MKRLFGKSSRVEIDKAPIKRARKRPLLFVCGTAALLLLALAFLLGLIFLKNPQKVPGNLPDADKRRIVQLTRWKTLTAAFDDLTQGEVHRFLRGLRVLRIQEINELRRNSDGTYRAYVVVPNPDQPDGSGFDPWWRHQLVKTNGAWIIIRSY